MSSLKEDSYNGLHVKTSITMDSRDHVCVSEIKNLLEDMFDSCPTGKKPEFRERIKQVQGKLDNIAQDSFNMGFTMASFEKGVRNA